MITINNLNIQYGKKHLFKDVSARINNGDRIGLIGVNGTGKSTLLKLIAGINESDSGVIVRGRQTTIGYLPQEISSFESGRTLYREAETAFAPLLAKQRQLEEINGKLSRTTDEDEEFSRLLQQQGELQNELDHADIFRLRSRIEKVLSGLGFKDDDLDKECRVFSGGWLMRLMLAKHLLARPDFLLLDEPTNHLDIESLTWLEEFLKTYPGGLVIISHDRAFLDNMTRITWELSLGRLTPYKGNYTKYLKAREERLLVVRAAYENQQARIQQTRRFVERFRAKSTKAKQVQSRVKQLEKMELIELEEGERKILFRFPPAAPSGRLAVEVKGLAKSFGSKSVFHDISFELDRGDKLAVVGVNGAGKSTLVKLLAGLIRPDSGKIRLGHQVTLSYFGQHQAQELAPGYTVLETMNHVEGEKSITRIRSLLGAFLFSGDEVDKKVAVLSGGEKSRLALARMILTPANLLVMDEPTNHLDMMSQEILQEAMKQYDGTVIVVSHNRFFLDAFVNKTLEIKNGRATVYDGNTSYYLEKVKQLAEIRQKNGGQAAGQQERNSACGSGKVRGKKARQLQARLRRELHSKTGELKKSCKKIEAEIETLENRREELERILADPDLYRDQEQFSEKSNEYGKIDDKLNRLYHKWETTQGRIEEIEAGHQMKSALNS